MRQWFFKLFDWPVKKIISTKILFASMKTLKNSETCTESRSEFFSWLTISVIGQFSPVITSHWTAEKYTGHGRFTEQFSDHSRDLEQILQ
jgi:hypothetical protein